MRRLLVVLAVMLATAFVAALIARAGSAGSPAAFRTPDAGAACRVEGPALVCSSLGSSGSVALRSVGSARIIRRLPWWDASTPVLHHWQRGAVACRLVDAAILCRAHGTTIRAAADGFAVAS
jgi:hypothetical protein